MRKISPHLLLILIILVFSPFGYTYIDDIQDNSNFRNIENNISNSQLRGIDKYFGKAPYKLTYEFIFITDESESFSILFTINETSFSLSTLHFRRDNEFFHEASIISNNKAILVSLKHSLPTINNLLWTNIDTLYEEEGKDNYSIMLDFIRFKIRES